MNLISGWIFPDGSFRPISQYLGHEAIAETNGFGTRTDAVKGGWIRTFKDASDNLNIEMWDAGDETAVDRLGDFLYDHWLAKFPRRTTVILEIHRPVNTYIYFTNGQMRDVGFKDLLADLVRAAILKSGKQ